MTNKLVARLMFVALVLVLFVGSAVPAAAAGKKKSGSQSPPPQTSSQGWSSWSGADGGWD